jgi:hypothetical protein
MRTNSREIARDLGFAGVVLLTRLPFLGPGAGNDTDGWYLVNAAREIAATGRYTTSRFPGYPIQEWLASLVARAGGGPVAMNALSALAAVGAAFAFVRLLRRLGARDAALAALAFVCVPAAWVASVSAMDYLFALAFVLAACHARLAGRAWLSGAWLGLAIGTRLTSAVLLPAVLLLPPPALGAPVAPAAGRRIDWRGMFLLTGIAVPAGAVCYLPAYARYGWGFLRFVDPLGTGSTPLDFLTGFLHLSRLPFPPALVVGQATALLWGVPGTLLLAAALVLGWVRRPAPEARAVRLLAPRVALAAVLAVALELALYLRLPHDEGYLIPAVPFTLLLVAAIAPRAWFRAACIGAIAGSFVFGVDVVPPKKGVAPLVRSRLAITRPAGAYSVVLDPLRGPLLQDHDKRVRAASIVSRVIAERPKLPPQILLFAGVLDAELTDRLPQDRKHPWYVDYLLEPDLRALVAQGTPVYLLPGARARVVHVVGYDPVAIGARPLFPGED